MARTTMMSYVEDHIDAYLNDIKKYAESMVEEEDQEEREDILCKLDSSINYLKEFLGI